MAKKEYKDYNVHKKYFLRYLKECGAYTAYLRNIRSTKYPNFYKQHYPSCTFESAAKNNGMQSMISLLFVWSKTPEGHEFWSNINKSYCKDFLKKFPDYPRYFDRYE